MTLCSEKMLVFHRCISGLMPNLFKNLVAHIIIQHFSVGSAQILSYSTNQTLDETKIQNEITTIESTVTEATIRNTTMVVHLIGNKPSTMIVFFWIFCGLLVLFELLLSVSYSFCQYFKFRKRRKKNHIFMIDA